MKMTTLESKIVCDYCKKPIDETKDYYVPWWEHWYLKISCLECSAKYEAEEKAKEKEAKENETNASMVFPKSSLAGLSLTGLRTIGA